jgi:hypothetical protein
MENLLKVVENKKSPTGKVGPGYALEKQKRKNIPVLSRRKLPSFPHLRVAEHSPGA